MLHTESLKNSCVEIHQSQQNNCDMLHLQDFSDEKNGTTSPLIKYYTVHKVRRCGIFDLIRINALPQPSASVRSHSVTH